MHMNHVISMLDGKKRHVGLAIYLTRTLGAHSGALQLFKAEANVDEPTWFYAGKK
jgi:hypothetical protein